MPLRELQNLGSNSSMSVGYHAQQHKVVHQVHSTGHMASEKTSEDISNALPVFDLSEFLALKNGEVPAKLVPQCQQLAECLASTGCVVVSTVGVPRLVCTQPSSTSSRPAGCSFGFNSPIKMQRSQLWQLKPCWLHQKSG